jgi:hypothetical protein
METDERPPEDPRFARLPDSAQLNAQQAGEFLGQAKDPTKALSTIRVKVLARAGRLRTSKLGDAQNAPFMFRMGELRRFKATWNRDPFRHAESEYDFDALPDDAEVRSARAASRFLKWHHVYVGESALNGLSHPRDPQYLHGRKLNPNRGGAWVFTMKELRRFKRLREHAAPDATKGE